MTEIQRIICVCVFLGPFLNSIWGKLQTFTSNCLYVNLHVTGVITRLAWYPLPILQSILLRTDIATTSDTPSFYQVLKILKQQIDAELPSTDESLEVIDGARSFLVDRENRLLNTRKTAIDAKAVKSEFGKAQIQTATVSATTPPQLTAGSSYDPFRRTENSRKSIRQSFSSIFKRPGSSGEWAGDLSAMESVLFDNLQLNWLSFVFRFSLTTNHIFCSSNISFEQGCLRSQI